MVAIEGRGKAGLKGKFTDGIPAQATVPVSVARIHGAAVVGVETQVRRQLVPGTATAGAAHARDGVWEGGDIGSSIGAIVRCAITVQVPADGVQLRQGGDLDQVVVVGVVVGRGLGSRTRDGQQGLHSRAEQDDSQVAERKDFH